MRTINAAAYDITALWLPSVRWVDSKRSKRNSAADGSAALLHRC
jgi:hypothetical protein